MPLRSGSWALWAAGSVYAQEEPTGDTDAGTGADTGHRH